MVKNEHLKPFIWRSILACTTQHIYRVGEKKDTKFKWWYSSTVANDFTWKFISQVNFTVLVDRESTVIFNFLPFIKHYFLFFVRQCKIDRLCRTKHYGLTSSAGQAVCCAIIIFLPFWVLILWIMGRLTNEDKIFIKHLHQHDNLSARQIVRNYAQREWSVSSVQRLISKIWTWYLSSEIIAWKIAFLRFSDGFCWSFKWDLNPMEPTTESSLLQNKNS